MNEASSGPAEPALPLGERKTFAHAAIALTGARQLRDSDAALTHRDLIGQAKGILMERFDLAPDAAFAALVRISSDNNVKLRQICEELCRTGRLPPPMRPRRQGQAA